MTFDVLVLLGFNGMMSSTSSVTVGVDVTEGSGGVVVITDVVEVVTVVVVATVVVSTTVMEDVVTVVEVVVTVTVLVVEVDVVDVAMTFFADNGLNFKMLFSGILVQKVRFIFHETNLMGSNGLNSTFGNDNFGKLNPLADITRRNIRLTIFKSQY